MDTSNDNIHKLLGLLDNPAAYSEQEIYDIINCDEDSRETYRLMVELKRSCRFRQTHQSIDVNSAWQRFDQRFQSKKQGPGWMKIAAAFIGVLLLSGIAFAAIHIIRKYIKLEAPQSQKQESVKTEITENVSESAATVLTDTLAKDTAIVQPFIYNNIPLEKMLPEIAAYYDAKVIFLNEDSRQLRFRFVWNPQQNIEQIVSDLNQFECLTVTLKEKQIVVE